MHRTDPRLAAERGREERRRAAARARRSRAASAAAAAALSMSCSLTPLSSILLYQTVAMGGRAALKKKNVAYPPAGVAQMWSM